MTKCVLLHGISDRAWAVPGMNCLASLFTSLIVIFSCFIARLESTYWEGYRHRSSWQSSVKNRRAKIGCTPLFFPISIRQTLILKFRVMYTLYVCNEVFQVISSISAHLALSDNAVHIAAAASLSGWGDRKRPLS